MTEFVRQQSPPGMASVSSHSVTRLPRSSSMYARAPHRIIVCTTCGQSHALNKNHLYDYPIEVDDDLLCQICLQPLVDPVDTPCGHTFCYSCLKSHLRRNPACPIDRQYLTERMIKSSNLLSRKILDKLTVVCPNTAYCDRTMPRCMLERHIKTQCPGTYVHCPRKSAGCRYLGPRNQLVEHLWSCPYGEDSNRTTGRKLPIVEGVPCLVEIPKGGDMELGLSVNQCERTGHILIDEIFVNGSAHRDGRLCPGDQIIKIDQQDFTLKSVAQARLALSATTSLVSLIVLRTPEEFDSADLEEVILTKDESRPLGLQIHTAKHRPGIYVHHVIAGSAAEECGKICRGDRIIEANGIDIRHSTIDEAAMLMAESMGTLHLLVHHRQHHRASLHQSTGSRSTLSTQSSPSVPSDHSNHLVYRQRLYEPLVAPSGYTVGSGKCIIIRKNPDESFGMNVSGGVGSECGDLPVFISDIRNGSVMDKCEKIQRGDIIVSINGISLLDRTHLEAVQTLKNLTCMSVVKLEMIQGDGLYEEGDAGLSPDWHMWLDRYFKERKSPLQYDVAIQREGDDSLGFSIVGGIKSSRGDSPIYVKSIKPKSIVAVDGRLKCRDQILRVNGQDLSFLTQNEVVQLIQATIGNIVFTVIPSGTT